jgi:hypothetical protein
MSDETRRIIIKKGAGVPTIPTSPDHRDGSWLATDIYEGEFYLDTLSNEIYTASGGVIMNVSSPSTTSASKLQHVVKLAENVTKGQAVYVSGATGTNMLVSKASNTMESTSSKTMGLIDATGVTNDFVNLVTEGLLDALDTSAATIGDPVWLGTSGNLLYGVANKPVAPAHMVFIGIVTRVSSTNGEIFVKVQNGFEIQELHNVLINSVADKDILYYENSTSLWKNATVSELLGYTPIAGGSEFKFIYAKSDLPAASGGVITLGDNVTYYITTTIDLTGDRIVGGINSTILGASSENCVLKSTGLSSSTALITSVYSLPVRNITITHGTALNLDGDGTTTALDWFGVNFTNCATIGTIKDYTNFIMNDSAFLNSGGLTFDGSIGTIGMTNCLFDCTTGATAITLPSTLTVTRRFRIIYSSFVVLSGETGINASASATISDERYILDTVNFSGGGTYLSGLDATSNKSLFANCIGITNTSTRGYIYMNNNTTATTTNNTALWFKAAGTTSASANNSKFSTSTSNRLTYTGAFSQSFMVSVNANVRTSVSTQNINIAIAKNGTVLTESEMTILCQTGSTPSFGATQVVVELTTNDYVELYVQNSSSANNTIVSDFNMNCVKIPV